MICIVLLAYNEAASLPALIPELERTLEGRPHRFIVVDDGSSDGTAAAARDLARRFPVTLVSHESNLGVARAFDTGLRLALQEAAPEDLVFTMEGDKTNDPAVLPAMIDKLSQGFDVVCASRLAPGGAYVGFPRRRHLLSLGANALTRFFFGIPGVRDYTIFYRGYRAAVLKRALQAYASRFIECRGFTANAEILLKVSKSGPLKCAEIATIYRYDLKAGASKMNVIENLLEYFRLFTKVTLG